LKKLFGDQTEEVEQLIHSCGGTFIQTNGTNYHMLSHACRVKLGIKICETGYDISRVVKFLTWQDFEFFVCQVAEEVGYRALHDIRMKKPRMQIDAVCIKGDFGISFDCKHWRYYSHSAISSAAIAQGKRSARLCESKIIPGVRRVLPAVVTIHETAIRLLDGVAIVPVNAINTFLLDAMYNFDIFTPSSKDVEAKD